MTRLMLLALPLMMLLLSTPAQATDVKLMTADQLKSRLDDANVVILDARGAWDWVKTDDKIVGAQRVDPGAANEWAADYDRNKTIVLYCA